MGDNGQVIATYLFTNVVIHIGRILSGYNVEKGMYIQTSVKQCTEPCYPWQSLVPIQPVRLKSTTSRLGSPPRYKNTYAQTPNNLPLLAQQLQKNLMY
jgi:hypothetical protein